MPVDQGLARRSSWVVTWPVCLVNVRDAEHVLDVERWSSTCCWGPGLAGGGSRQQAVLERGRHVVLNDRPGSEGAGGWAPHFLGRAFEYREVPLTEVENRQGRLFSHFSFLIFLQGNRQTRFCLGVFSFGCQVRSCRVGLAAGLGAAGQLEPGVRAPVPTGIGQPAERGVAFGVPGTQACKEVRGPSRNT